MQLTQDDRALIEVIEGAVLRGADRLGIAVSGGGDSVALLHLAQACCKAKGLPLFAATVDHGLRPDSADEAQAVARMAADLDIDHSILTWERREDGGNLQDQARRARYDLLADWARDLNLDRVALGHTADDQAENFLIRLTRKAGVDGLSEMAREFEWNDVRFCRPMLGLERAELRAFLTRHMISWSDDPSNENEDFERIRMRKALVQLAPLGIDTVTLSAVSRNLGAARRELSAYAREVAENTMKIDRGDVIWTMPTPPDLTSETARRLLVHGLSYVSCAPYAPRNKALEQAKIAIAGQKPTTLHGCLIAPDKSGLRIGREYAGVQDHVTATTEIWDGRWRMQGPHDGVLVTRALGETGLAQCPEWRETGLPRASIIASPAIWRGEELVAGPLANLDNGWAATLMRGEDQFFSSIITH